MRVTPHLRNLRGEGWRRLIDRVLSTPDASLDHLAFSLLIIRLCNCITCHTNSYRALRGCTVCAKHAVLRFRENDENLVQCYDSAYRDVFDFMEAGRPLLDGMKDPTLGDNIHG